jgi:ribosomal protein L32
LLFIGRLLDPTIKIQLLGGRQQVQQQIADEGAIAPSGKFGNFSEYIDYSKEVAIKLQKVIRDSEANYEALGRPSLYKNEWKWESVRRELMDSVLDEAPAKVEDVEMFDDYNAQGVIDEVLEANARVMVPRKKRSIMKRRGRRMSPAVAERISVPRKKRSSMKRRGRRMDSAVDDIPEITPNPIKRIRRSNVRNFDQ